jgi:hypothetical protein
MGKLSSLWYSRETVLERVKCVASGKNYGSKFKTPLLLQAEKYFDNLKKDDMVPLYLSPDYESA